MKKQKKEQLPETFEFEKDTKEKLKKLYLKPGLCESETITQI